MQEKPIATLIEKIAKECEEANADKWTITKIVKKLSDQKETDLKTLRKHTLEMLQLLDPKAAAIYASFQKMEVRTSRQVVEGFDRGNIIKSLLRETEVARGVAEKIGREVEEKIKDLEIERISTPLIREMVNVKLLEYGHENIRNQYTRVGLPVFEVKKKIAQSPYKNNAMLTEYNLLRVIPDKIGRMHLSNEIFIAELQDFSTRPIAITIETEIEETPRDTVFNLLEKAHRQEKMFSWRPNITGLNTAISAKTSKKTARDSATLFTKAAKAIFLNAKAVPAYNTLHLFESENYSKKGIERESMTTTTNTILKANTEEPSPTFQDAVAIDTKYKLKLLKQPPKTIINCRNKEWTMTNGITFEGKGLCSFTAINLTAIALKSQENETLFFEELEEKTRAIKELDKLKRKKLDEREYLKKQGTKIDELHTAIAFDNLTGTSQHMTNSNKDSEIASFAEKIITEIKQNMPENTVLAELKNQRAIQKFTAHNIKKLHQSKKFEEKEKILQKSKNICKNYSFTAKATNRKQLNELIDNNTRLIEFKEKE